MTNSSIGAASRALSAGRARGCWGLALGSLALGLIASDAFASSGGIVNRTRLDGGAGCGGCHSPTQSLGVALSGPTSLNITQVGSYSILISAGPASTNIGINVAASSGTLSESAANLQILSGEITHTGTLNTTNLSGSGSYSFSYQLPNTATIGQTYTLYGTARSGNFWNHDNNDHVITVVAAPQAALTSTLNGSAAPSAVTAGNGYALATSGGSGTGAVTFSSLTTGVCTVAGSTVNTIAVGTCTVRGTKAGDTQYSSTFDDVSVTVNQGSQTITFNTLADKLTTDPPFLVAATGGASGNPVTFTATGACSHGGTNGATISLTGVAGTCTVTANQAGNANYTAASAVMRAFNVVDAGAEVFPPNCVMPAAWTVPAGSTTNWVVATDDKFEGSCSFKSNTMPHAGTPLQANMEVSGAFNNGNITLRYRTSTEGSWDCLQVLIDGVAQELGGSCGSVGLTGASGDTPWTAATIPITAGNHTVTLRYDKDDSCCFSGLDAVWIDLLNMPMSTSITSATFAFGTFGQFLTYNTTATNFPVVYSATGLPPGMSINTSTGVISGTPSAAGNYTAMVSASNPAGVNPAASDLKSVTFFIGKAAQNLSFPPINGRLTTAPAFTAAAAGGGSGNPVTFTATGVCSHGGTNGATITLSGATGTCTVTAEQAGDANYADASAVMQSFEVTLAAAEIFPPACAMPAGWTVPMGATTGWTVSTNESSSAGACSLKSQPMANSGTPLQASIQFSGTFASGFVNFKYRVSTENGWDCLQFFIDGVVQNLGGSCSSIGLTGASGSSGWVDVSVPIGAGAHTLQWRYDKDDTCCANGEDTVYIDEVVMPLFTLSVSKAGAGAGTVTSNPGTINCGMTCSNVLSGTVELTATPNFLNFFAGWSGACSGTGTCVVSMTANRSVTATFSPATPPGPPQNVSATPGDGQASFSFTAPASDGGSPIQSYGVNCAAMGQPTVLNSGAGSPIVVTGMANGVQYTCNVGASNFAGSGPTVTVMVTPRTVPTAPTGLMAVAGNAQATLSFGVPMSNGGAMITGYTATCSSVSLPDRTATGAASPLTVTGMTNGAPYTCVVVATNAAGNGTQSNVASVTPRTVPGTPGVNPRALDGRLSVDVTAPMSDGGSPITGYTMTCNPGSLTVSGPNGPLTLTGRTNGVTLTCGVVATNAAGDSAAATFMATPQVNTGTALFASVCTACHAAPPTVPQLNAAGTTATVLSYVIANQPSMNADFYVSGLTTAERTAIATYLRGTISTAALTTPFNTPRVIDLSSQITLNTISFDALAVVTPPANGTLSAFTGTSITYTPNAGYAGADSFTFRGTRSSVPLLGDARTVNLTVQPPPVPVITSAGTASGTNGQPFSYQITATNGPTSFGASGFPGGLTINAMTGLVSGSPTSGGTFNALVSATNAGGAGTMPVTVTINPASQTITFPAQSPATRAFAPAPSNTFAVNPLATSTSGLTVTYVTKTPGTCSVAGSTVTMLAAGTCTLGANQAGNASYTVATEVTRDITITPILPGAPAIGAATPGNTQAAIAFTAPSNTGGTAITGYAASCTPSGTGTGGASPIVVTGLVNGTTYTCSVRASNSVGQGPASGTVMVTPAPTPTAPAITSANNTTFTVNAPGSFNATATGTPSTFTWSLTGSLPAGVTLNTGSGVISGTPTAAGTFMVTLGVTNGVMPNASQAFTLTVAKAAQSITFGNPGTRTLGTGTVALSAAATSGLAVTFASDTPAVCTVAGSNATLVAVGTCTLRAQQAGNANFNAATDVTQSFTVLQGSQAITFGAQSSPRAYVNGGTFGLMPVGTASSGLAVTHTSLTTAVCTIAGTTVTMVRAGNCTIAANQAGNANYAPAAQVTQSISLTGVAPGAPTLDTATAGDGRVTLAFTAPASDGGGSITGYTATCGAAAPVGGGGSPIVVTGLMNGTSYSCSVTATNAFGTSLASNAIMATPAALPGATVWAMTCGQGFCHGNPPQGTRLNVGAAGSAVLDYVIPRQPAMNTFIGGMSMADRVAVSQYVREFIPAVNVVTPLNTAATVDVGTQVFLNTAVAALTTIEVVSPPASGTLGAFTGTSATYTPANGFVGTVSFTYRARNLVGPVDTDTRSVTITVQGAAPAITSSLTAAATVSQAFSYQIAASNAPTSYGASGLPGWLSVNTGTGVLSGTPPAAGSHMVTISATNGSGTGNATLTINVAAIPQAITFGAQASPIAFVNGGTVMIAPTATGGSSGNPIVYSSTTPSVCSVSGATFTMISAGICTIAANQAGSATHAAAPQVTQSVTITGTAPGAPTIGAGAGGNTTATVNFTAPASNGGLTITSYTVNCGGFAASGPASPITVSGLTNGVTYSCSVQASNAAGTGPASGTVMVAPVAAMFDRAFSRKVHGAAGPFDIELDHTQPVTGNVTVEPRAIGMGHTIVFRLTGPATSAGTVTVSPMSIVANATTAGNEVIVTLTNVPDVSRATVVLNNVNGGLTMSTSIGFLLGDANSSRQVLAADLAALRAQVGKPVDASTFRLDVNATGLVSAADIAAAKQRLNVTLP